MPVSSPATPLFLFAPGAGAPSTSPWMEAWKARLTTLGTVSTFDYPYTRAGRTSPDRHPVLLAAHRQAWLEAQTLRHDPGPAILVGKSMGSRIGCHLAVELTKQAEPGPPAPLPAALICFGYPLRSASSGALRDEVLRALATPILFLQGSRDPLCPLSDLDKVRQEMVAPHELVVVEGGDHSLRVGVRALRSMGKTQEDSDGAVTEAINRFVRTLGT